ncbi:MAG: DUF1877 domain-containing protein [Citrobacter freundii]|nr:MAG: DUF1877 domain-containing protein [Citrobacter freundii]
MVLNFLRVSEDELNEILENSAFLDEILYDENDEPAPTLTDIDKSWEGILFILTGQNLETLDHPLGAALFSGQVVDEDQDMGYGPAHYLTPGQVETINEQLGAFTVEEVKARYNPARMTELSIYPGVWDKEDDQVFEYLLEWFLEVKQIYTTAAAEKQAVITFMS